MSDEVSACKYCDVKPHTPGSHHKTSCPRYTEPFRFLRSREELEERCDFYRRYGYHHVDPSGPYHNPNWPGR